MFLFNRKTWVLGLTLALCFFCQQIFASFTPASDYQIVLKGLNSSKIESLFFEKSLLVKNRKKISPHDSSWDALLKKDQKLLEDLLQTYFFFDAQITETTIEDKTPTIKVYLQIEKGPRYTLQGFQIIYPEGPGLNIPPDTLGIKTLHTANYYVLSQARQTLLHKAKSKGFAFAKLEELQLDIDQEKKQVTAIQKIWLQKKYQFGPVKVVGNSRYSAEDILHFISWQPGDLFSQAKLQKTEKLLSDSQWFTSAFFSYPKEAAATSKMLPLTLSVKEQKPRAIAMGVKYDSQEALGGLFEWENQDINSYHDQFKTNLEISKENRKLAAQLLRPNFLDTGKAIGIKCLWIENKLGAEQEHAISLEPFMQHKLNAQTSYLVGINFERNFRVDPTKQQTESLISLPTRFIWSNRPNTPIHSGSSVKLQLTPAKVLSPQIHHFFPYLLTLAHSFKLEDEMAILLWGDLGGTMGTQIENIPLHYRFFGGSSRYFRGYSYHSVPYSKELDRPTGGKSLYLLGVEYRRKLYQRLYTGLFYELGNVSHSSGPQLQANPLSSIGLSLQYFFDFGPIKLDIALPLKRRILDNKHIDKRKLQFHLQVGDSF